MHALKPIFPNPWNTLDARAEFHVFDSLLTVSRAMSHDTGPRQGHVQRNSAYRCYRQFAFTRFLRSLWTFQPAHEMSIYGSCCILKCIVPAGNNTCVFTLIDTCHSVSVSHHSWYHIILACIACKIDMLSAIEPNREWHDQGWFSRTSGSVS